MLRSTCLLAALMTLPLSAAEKSAAERGKEALIGQAYVPGMISRKSYDELWRTWGLKEKPADFDKQLRERYGLHEAPYPNNGLPMGLRETKGLLGKGVANDCLKCHAGLIAGQTMLGLGNTTLDMQTLLEDFASAQGIPNLMPFELSHVRGTTEAAASAAYLFQFRNPDLSLREPTKLEYSTTACEDVPAWWLLKKKKTMYATGSHSAQAVRPLMAFLLTPFNSAETIKKHEATFRDVHAYILSLEAPKYPFAIDATQAAQGQLLFEKNCARCHGTYGPDGTYPNRWLELEDIGTDRTLAAGFPKESEATFNDSWFGQEKGPDGKQLVSRIRVGYQAPPLDGVWATAPYFHNGAAPTLAHVLNSKSRPKFFTRSYKTSKDDYDTDKVGLKITVLEKGADPRAPGREQRKIYDTTKPGRGNGGHTFGDKFSNEERRAVIEYLKTL